MRPKVGIQSTSPEIYSRPRPSPREIPPTVPNFSAGGAEPYLQCYYNLHPVTVADHDQSLYAGRVYGRNRPYVTRTTRPLIFEIMGPSVFGLVHRGVNATGTFGVAGRVPKTRESRRRRRRGGVVWGDVCPFPENL